jgi:hypothetical protein
VLRRRFPVGESPTRQLLLQPEAIEAKTFYEHHGFVASPTQPMTLILSLKGVRRAKAAFSSG